MTSDFKINLLPNDIRKRKLNQQKFSRNLLYAILITLAFVTLNIVMWTVEYSYSVSQSNLKTSIADYEQKITALKSTQDSLQALNYKLQVSNSLDQQVLQPDKILSAVSALTPQEITLTNVDLDLTKKPPISLQGTASTRRDIVVFNDSLNKSEAFTGADTASTAKSTDASKPDGVSFTITVSIKGSK